MVFLVKGFAQKEEGEAKDAVVVAETLSVAVGELCLDLGFLLGCAGNGVYFVAGGREGAGLFSICRIGSGSTEFLQFIC